MDHSGTLNGTAALLVAVAAGDQAAWSQVVASHGPDAWKLVRGLFRGQHEAEDAYQEFWLRLPRAAAGFRPQAADGTTTTDGAARAWLMRVAYTTAMDRHRQQRAVASVPLGDIQPATEVPMDDSEARKLLVEQVRSVIDDLPEHQRRPLMLHLIGGLGYEELAADLRCSVVNARVRVHRALKRVRDRLGVKEEGLPDRALAGLLVPPLVPAPPAAPPLADALAHVAGGGAGGALAGAGVKAALLGGAAVVVAGAVGIAVAVGRPVPSSPAPLAAVTAPAVVPAVAAPARAAKPGLLDDFEGGSLEAISTNGALLALVPAGDGRSGTALDVGWPAAHGKFVDFMYPLPRAVPGLTTQVGGTAVFWLWQPPGRPLSSIGIRFVDAWSETYQWAAPLPADGAPGWHEVRIPLTAGNFVGHWGSAEGRPAEIVLPLRFIGFGLDFTSTAVPAGAVRLDDPCLESP